MSLNYCPKCGKDIKKSDARFCPACGHFFWGKGDDGGTGINGQNRKEQMQLGRNSDIKTGHAAFWEIVSIVVILVICIIVVVHLRWEAQNKNIDKAVESVEEATAKVAPEHENNQQEVTEKMVEEVSESENFYINIDSWVYDMFGKTYATLTEQYGEPDWDSGSEDWLGRQLSFVAYDLYLTQAPNYYDHVAIVAGTFETMTDMDTDSVYQIEEVVKALGIEEDVEYYISEGLGDFSYETGSHVASGKKDNYVIDILYYANGTVDKTCDIFITDMNIQKKANENDAEVNRVENTGIVESVVEDENVENEVSAIREIYNNIVRGVQNGNYYIERIPEQTATVYRDGTGEIVRVDIKDSNFYEHTVSLYYYDARLIFAYYENTNGGSDRLYFKDEKLFRWRHCDDSQNSSDGVNHDNEKTVEFKQMESMALTQSESILANM